MADEPERQDLEAYAQGVLDERERARVEAHVQDCAECAAELSEYRSVIALLPAALHTEDAPSSAWDAIERTIGRHEVAAPRSPASIGRWRFGRWHGLPRKLQPALLGITAAAVIGLIAWNASLQTKLSDRHTTLVAPGNTTEETVVELTARIGQNSLGGRLFMSGDRQQGGLVVAGLPELASGRSYQVWFIRPDQSRAPAGVFRVDNLGQAVFLVAVPQPTRDFNGVAITEEPEGGSGSPSSYDLLAGPIYEQ